MSQQELDQRRVSFHDVAACFSEEEWKLLHQWQKELYRNVMYEIHQAVSSLGPLISTAVFSLREKENRSMQQLGQQESESSQVNTSLDVETLITAPQEEAQFSEVCEGLESRGTDESHSTENPIITSVFSLCHGHGSEGEYHFKPEGRNPAPDPVMTSAFSLLQYWEENPLKVEQGTEDEATGNGFVSRNCRDVEAIKCNKITSPFIAQTEKTRSKLIQSSERGRNCASQPWSEPNQELRTENITTPENGFRNFPHSVSHHRRYNIERSESNLRNTTCSTFSSNAQQVGCHQSTEWLNDRRALSSHEHPQKERKRKGGYPCTQCEKRFRSKTTLLAHNRTHTRKKQHQCTQCTKCFVFKAHLANHQKFHANEAKLKGLPLDEKHGREYERNVTLKVTNVTHSRRPLEKERSSESEQPAFEKKGSITHITVPSAEKPYKCTECDKCFKQKAAVLIHHRTHTGEKPYHCSTCEKSFRIKSHLVGHERSHTGEKPYKCTRCEKTFSQKGNLMVHFKRRHEMEESPECADSVPRKESVIAGIRTHNGESSYNCSQCEKSFRVEARLVSHQKSHLVERPYPCTKCERRFIYKGNLILHLSRHDDKVKNPESKISFFQRGGVKPYACAHCEKVFTMKAHLVNHQKRHLLEESFQCPHCEKTFRLKGSLRVHIGRHHASTAKNSERKARILQRTNIQKPLQCTHCEKSFRLKAHLASHQRRHKREKAFPCSECQNVFNQKTDLMLHIRSSHVTGANAECKGGMIANTTLDHEKPYHCTQCDKRFRLKDQFEGHQRAHSGEKPYECIHCRMRFCQKGGLYIHIKRHHGVRKAQELKTDVLQTDSSHNTADTVTPMNAKPFQCNQCEKSFKLRAHLGSHKKRHIREKLHQCTQCKKSFSQKAHLVIHLRKHHENGKSDEDEEPLPKDSPLPLRGAGEGTYPCTQCEKSFHRKSALFLHHKIHKHQKSYQCKTCLKSFGTRGRLFIHQRIHPGEKPFQCTTCERGYTTKAQLVIHQRIHTGEKPFHCTACEKRFTTKTQLGTHQRTHTGEKPFQCNLCEKSFAQKGNLYVHMTRKHHGKESNTESKKELFSES
ncbi:zinc finger protein 84-like isoform X1 [Ambystoma mexicanum]|uniref:zinc finger protein 84-like isoform X1 n=1 Tax=Ambystoma mexicanum TaxID=8296 RepID=UPI0037E8B95B